MGDGDQSIPHPPHVDTRGDCPALNSLETYAAGHYTTCSSWSLELPLVKGSFALFSFLAGLPRRSAIHETAQQTRLNHWSTVNEPPKMT